jgi:hypothetical protein
LREGCESTLRIGSWIQDEYPDPRPAAKRRKIYSVPDSRTVAVAIAGDEVRKCRTAGVVLETSVAANSDGYARVGPVSRLHP